MTSSPVSASRRVLLVAAVVGIGLLTLFVGRGPGVGQQTVRNGRFLQLNHQLANDLPRPNPTLLQQFETLAAQSPDAPGWTGFGLLLAAAGQEDAARAAWQRVDDIGRVLVWHGVQQTGQDASGLVWFERATAVDPDFAEGWFRVARVYVAQEQYPAAIQAYAQAIALAPDDRDAWTELGSTYAAAGEWEAARRSYAAALDATAGQQPASGIWYRIGGTFQDQRPPDLAAAVDAYEAGLMLNEFGPMPHVEGLIYTELGRIALQQEQVPTAVDYLQQALAILPSDYGTLLLLADARWQQHQPQQTFDLLEQAIAVNPQRKPAYFRLARYFEQASQPDAARATYERLLAQYPDDERARTAVDQLTNP